ncbi:MAG: transcriptional regulator [Acidobacteria bacterium]|nr:transcriptional regulator [Acidobacteriota bacterium]
MKSTTKKTGKKTAAAKFDATKYRRLVARAMPVIIETEAENERLLAIVEKMMSRDLSLEEERLFNLLVKLIEDFETRHYPMGDVAPYEMLRFLMEQRDLRQRDVVHLFGSSGVASEVINGKRAISKAQAKKLAEFFHVSVEVFV